MRRLVLVIVCWLPMLAQALELTGSLQQGAMVIGKVAPGSQVYFQQQAITVSDEGVFVIGFDRDAGSRALLLVQQADGQNITRTLAIKARDYKIQRIEGIAKKITHPSASDLTRIQADAKLVREARAAILLREDFTQAFQWPLKGPITGVFGSQRVYNGAPGRPHYGVDVAAATGTAVTTPVSGKVVLAHQDLFYSGGTVIIDHGHGVSSTMMHLSKVLVAVGDEVTPGDIIAEVGATGRATGPHLDWRMNWRKARIDPQLLVPAM